MSDPEELEAHAGLIDGGLAYEVAFVDYWLLSSLIGWRHFDMGEIGMGGKLKVIRVGRILSDGRDLCIAAVPHCVPDSTPDQALSLVVLVLTHASLFLIQSALRARVILSDEVKCSGRWKRY